MTDDFEVRESTDRAGVITLAIHGDLEASTVNRFETALNRAVSSGAAVVELDLSEVGFIGSEAIGTLIRTRDVSTERVVRVCIIEMSSRVRRVLELMALDDYFT